MTMSNCANCSTELPPKAKFCPGCGQPVPPPPPAGAPGAAVTKGDVGLDRSVTHFTTVRQSDAEQMADYCPICGSWVARRDSFRCRECGRSFLCHHHRDPERNICLECVAREPVAPQETLRQPAAPPAERPTAARPTPDSSRSELAPGVWLEWVDVPSGEFLMGSGEDDRMAFDDEKPQRRVYVDAYRIGKYPVTNVQYRAFVVAAGHSMPGHWEGDEIPAGKENHPVVEVNWEEAVAYCGWASGVTGEQIRLPSEAEWEKAARGTDGRRYPWGKEWQEGRCNLKEAGVLDTTPVGRYRGGVCPYGAHDMAGNVREWTDSWYQAYPGSTRKAEAYGRKNRVLRGGSWNYFERNVRAAYRDRIDPSIRDSNVGFRCASTSP